MSLITGVSSSHYKYEDKPLSFKGMVLGAFVLLGGVESRDVRPLSGGRVSILPYERKISKPGIYCPDDPIHCYHLSNAFADVYHRQIGVFRSGVEQVAGNRQIEEWRETAKDDHILKVQLSDGDGKMILMVIQKNSCRVQNSVATIEHVQHLYDILGTLTPKQVKDEILKTNGIVQCSSDPVSFRKLGVIVLKGDDASSGGKLMEFLNAKRDRVAASILHKISKDPDNSHWTDEEKALVSPFCYIPPHWKEVPALMTKFATRLKKGLLEMDCNPNFDVIDFAAFIHLELVRIHPFADGNGRVARVLMNEILKRGGYQTPVFNSDDEYTKALEKGPEFFASWLGDTVIPWTEREFRLDPCLPEVTC